MSTRSRENYYELLHVSPHATHQEIKRASRQGVRATHPDVGEGPIDLARFQRLQHAYEVLADPSERRRYDMTLSLGAFAGRTRFYHRSYTRLFDTLFNKLQAALQSSLMLAEEPPTQRRRAG
jgi:molecular chaperone DnaJ